MAHPVDDEESRLRSSLTHSARECLDFLRVKAHNVNSVEQNEALALIVSKFGGVDSLSSSETSPEQLTEKALKVRYLLLHKIGIMRLCR